MDTELRFVSSLLTSNRAEQEEFWSKQLPLNTFLLRERELAWIYAFREKHGKFPSAQAFELKFEEELGNVHDPLSATLDPILTQATHSRIKDVIDSTAKLFNEKKDCDEIIEHFRAKATALQAFGANASYVDENLNNPDIAFRRYAERLKKKDDPATFMTTPWPRLNKILKFVRPGEVVVLAARPAMGKSWILFDWLNHLASSNIETLLFSKEMPTDQCSDRITALRYKLDYEKFRGMDLDIMDQVRWKKEVRKAAKHPYPLLVSGEETFEGIGMEQLYTKAQLVKPRVIAIDGAYLLTVKGLSRNATDPEKFAAISRASKRMAKVLNCAVFVVIQMNRSAEDKSGKAKGGLVSAFGSDAWAQDADVFIEVQGDRKAPERVLCVHKSRDTNIGDVAIDFKMTPYPCFTEKAALSTGNAAAIPFRPLK